MSSFDAFSTKTNVLIINGYSFIHLVYKRSYFKTQFLNATNK